VYSAGELRLVYGLYIPEQGLRDLTWILEYDLPLTATYPNPKKWAEAIAELSRHPMGVSLAFAIDDLITEVLKSGEANRFRRLRINEQLFGMGWDMREFHWDRETKNFIQVALKQEPDRSLNFGGSELFQWILEQPTHSQSSEEFQVPAEMRGGRALVPEDGFRWFPNTEGDAFEHFNRNTCSGCHSGATGTSFMHIEPREGDRESRISPFLSGEMLLRLDDLKSRMGGEGGQPRVMSAPMMYIPPMNGH